MIRVTLALALMIAGAFGLIGGGARGRQHQPVSNSMCPPGSEVFTLPASNGGTQEFTKVILADYPSTGSSWLKRLLTAASENYAEGTCTSPSCSIYKESECKDGDAYCPCQWDAANGAMMVKTHFPAQELFRQIPLQGRQYRRSNDFDKFIYLLRHPVATVNSNNRRWGGGWSVVQSLECWGHWWERAKAEVGDSNVHLLRYETLCLDTARTLHGLLQFLGGCYASIPISSVRRTLEANPELECIHKHDLVQLAGGVNAQMIIDQMQEFLAKWGYTASMVSSWATVETLVQNVSHAKDFSSKRNPWVEPWET